MSTARYDAQNSLDQEPSGETTGVQSPCADELSASANCPQQQGPLAAAARSPKPPKPLARATAAGTAQTLNPEDIDETAGADSSESRQQPAQQLQDRSSPDPGSWGPQLLQAPSTAAACIGSAQQGLSVSRQQLRFPLHFNSSNGRRQHNSLRDGHSPAPQGPQQELRSSIVLRSDTVGATQGQSAFLTCPVAT